MDLEMRAKKYELEIKVEEAKLEYYNRKIAVLRNTHNGESWCAVLLWLAYFNADVHSQVYITTFEDCQSVKHFFSYPQVM